MVEAKIEMAQVNMEATIEKNHRGSEIESNYRLSITSADQHYYSNPIFQTQFLHSFRPVDLTAGSCSCRCSPALNTRRNYGFKIQ